MNMQHPQHRLCDWWRVPRVFWHLIKSPRDVYSYCRFGIQTKHTPLDLGVPWWSFGATRFVESVIHSEIEVFEFGSGGSSIFLASRTARVTSVEDEAMWVNLVQEMARRQNIENLELLHRPYDFYNPDDFHQSDYLSSIGSSFYDLIVVDGKEESEQVRDICFWRAEKHIKPGGMIILDDSWRYPQVKTNNMAQRWREFKGTGYCRLGVTSTCVFYY